MMSSKLVKHVGSDRWPSDTEEDAAWVGDGNIPKVNMMDGGLFRGDTKSLVEWECLGQR